CQYLSNKYSNLTASKKESQTILPSVIACHIAVFAGAAGLPIRRLWVWSKIGWFWTYRYIPGGVPTPIRRYDRKRHEIRGKRSISVCPR
ncbi:MAG: hypothetical protein WCA78_00820, partial [Rhizomicrobium sp.]